MKPFKYLVKGVFLIMALYTIISIGLLGIVLYTHHKYELSRGMDR